MVFYQPGSREKWPQRQRPPAASCCGLIPNPNLDLSNHETHLTRLECLLSKLRLRAGGTEKDYGLSVFLGGFFSVSEGAKRQSLLTSKQKENSEAHTG